MNYFDGEYLLVVLCSDLPGSLTLIKVNRLSHIFPLRAAGNERAAIV